MSRKTEGLGSGKRVEWGGGWRANSCQNWEIATTWGPAPSPSQLELSAHRASPPQPRLPDKRGQAARQDVHGRTRKLLPPPTPRASHGLPGARKRPPAPPQPRPLRRRSGPWHRACGAPPGCRRSRHPSLRHASPPEGHVQLSAPGPARPPALWTGGKQEGSAPRAAPEDPRRCSPPSSGPPSPPSSPSLPSCSLRLGTSLVGHRRRRFHSLLLLPSLLLGPSPAPEGPPRGRSAHAPSPRAARTGLEAENRLPWQPGP